MSKATANIFYNNDTHGFNFNFQWEFVELQQYFKSRFELQEFKLYFKINVKFCLFNLTQQKTHTQKKTQKKRNITFESHTQMTWMSLKQIGKTTLIFLDYLR